MHGIRFKGTKTRQALAVLPSYLVRLGYCCPLRLRSKGRVLRDAVNYERANEASMNFLSILFFLSEGPFLSRRLSQFLSNYVQLYKSKAFLREDILAFLARCL